MSVTKLSDRFAGYLLRIKWRKCGHESVTEPNVSDKLLAWETPLTTAARRLLLQVRGECELTAIDTPKPRGYRSER